MALPVNRGRERETTYVHSDACARPGADRRGPPPIQEAVGAERAEEGIAKARVLREAVRAPPPGRTPQAARDPQGEDGSPPADSRGAAVRRRRVTCPIQTGRTAARCGRTP